MEKNINYPERKAKSVESMLESMFQLPAWIGSVVNFIDPQVSKIIDKIDFTKINQIYMTGCGDSYFAPEATRLAFEKYTGIKTESIEALEFSRYAVDYIHPGSLVIGISNSGSTSRPLEAIRLSKGKGAVRIAITGNDKSPMSQSADFTLIQAKQDWNETLMVSGYLASTLALYVISLYIGLKNSNLDQSKFNSLYNLVKQSSEIIQDTLHANNEKVKNFAFENSDAPFYQILGGGPSYGTALFAAAKLFEQPKVNGLPIQLEEWAHQQFFITNENTPLFAITPPGASNDRAKEQLQGARDVGAIVAAICDVDDTSTREIANESFPIMGKLPEELSPLTYFVPSALFATHLCSAQGLSEVKSSQLHYDVNMRQIRESNMREE